MPRVSEVLDYFCEPYLVKWKLKNKDWEKVSKDATTIGSLIDGMVQMDINGLPVGLTEHPEASNCWKAWLKFKEENPKVYERMVKHRYNMQKELVLGNLTGHPDFLLDDEQEVVDLKTSKRVSKSHWMQTAQYGKMAYGGAKRITILRVCKLTGEYELVSLEGAEVEFWRKKFQCRYEAFMEEQEWSDIMRLKGEEGLLNELSA